MIDPQAVGGEVTLWPGVNPTNIRQGIFAGQGDGPGRQPVVKRGQTPLETGFVPFSLGQGGMAGASDKTQVLVVVGLVGGFAQGENDGVVEGEEGKDEEDEQEGGVLGQSVMRKM